MLIRKLTDEHERAQALNLALKVFMQYEAPDYPEHGATTFRDFIQSREMTDELLMFGAIEDGTVVGVIALRNEGSHISLFFVDGRQHRKGIGRKLFQAALQNNAAETITVNSSPYAVEVYRRLGFIETDKEQLTNGLRYIPMVYHRQKV
jgi:GNAT superfamily N-acetyltransferase